jgi:putative hydrolase of HD superfamily
VAEPPNLNARLDAQIRFVIEIDKVKHVLRQTDLMDGSRRENDAEHSWHLAVMALLLAEYAAGDIDLSRVARMVLIHDLVEIDAGDTFCYDEEGAKDKAEREQAAADRIFAVLPDDQAVELRALWDEFEARETADAKFAASLDRLQPLMHNYHTQGAAWRRHGIVRSQVVSRNEHIAEGAPVLWEYARRLIDDAVTRGYLAEG